MTFSELYNKYKWKKIYGCPGRYSLSGNQRIGIKELAGVDSHLEVYHSKNTKDPFYAIPISDGGIISYLKDEGVQIHTLNTVEGFKRKLKDLGMNVNDKGII